jgi:hypothetical protein
VSDPATHLNKPNKEKSNGEEQRRRFITLLVSSGKKGKVSAPVHSQPSSEYRHLCLNRDRIRAGDKRYAYLSSHSPRCGLTANDVSSCFEKGSSLQGSNLVRISKSLLPGG